MFGVSLGSGAMGLVKMEQALDELRCKSTNTRTQLFLLLYLSSASSVATFEQLELRYPMSVLGLFLFALTIRHQRQSTATACSTRFDSYTELQVKEIHS